MNNVERDSQPYSGYYQATLPGYDPELAEVGPGTPCGEYLRRFWHAIAMSSELSELPKRVRLFGEDLVLFRNLSGQAGLLHLHCAHRQASLEYGRIERSGIRCCYHGWLFGVDGRILEIPAEPPDGKLSEKIRSTVCQGAYPVHEYKGLIFAYMGPPKLKPEFPIFDTFEIPDTTMEPYIAEFPCNWLQVTENGIDPVHSMYLHTLVTGPQFSETWGIVGDVAYHNARLGTYCTIGRRVGDHIWVRIQENILPNMTQSGAVLTMDGKNQRYFGRNTFFRWCVPVDDTNTKVVAWANFGDRTDPKALKTQDNIELIEQGVVFGRSYEEEQRNPGDYAAMTGQGSIVRHAREHMVSSDRGVALFRSQLRRDVRALGNGQEPRQPGDNSVRPIPTYSGDTVLHIPRAPLPSKRDRALIRTIVDEVYEAYVSGDHLSGSERDLFIQERLRQLEV